MKSTNAPCFHFTIMSALSRRMNLALLITVLATGTTRAGSQRIVDSNFDDLDVGTAPDNDVAAGPWQITLAPPDVQIDLSEDSAEIFSIVPTSSFDRDSEGNSLRVESMNRNTNATHFFPEPVFGEDVDIVRASFDVFISDLSDGRRGAPFIILGGNDDAPYALFHERRGPNLFFNNVGQLRNHESTDRLQSTIIVDETPLDRWQHVQLDIDVASRSYDVFWSTDGATPALVATRLPFQSNPKFFDRFVISTFPISRGTSPDGVGYVDNIRVETINIDWIGDANLDGEFNSSDLVTVFGAGRYETGEVAAWSQGDWNDDRLFNSGDLVAAFRDGGYEMGTRPSVAAVPEPSSLLMMLSGMLGIGRIRTR